MAELVSHLQPDEAWLPWTPTAGQPFDRRLAAHLLRRAGFGGNATEIAAVAARGPHDAVADMLATAERGTAFDAEMRTVAATVLAAGNPELLAGWWLYRMRHTPAPLLEKLTLFWHGHFATSAAKVRSAPLMLRQNELLRQRALGPFSELLGGIARDAAMLLYLDSATNRKSHPNENFAREVMELFCLGVGRYSERDIQELARCFTGWEIQRGEFKFNSYQHDTGRKTVLGASATSGEDGLRIILQHPATAEFLCTKLVRFYVTDDEMPPHLIAPLAAQFRASGLNLASILKTILTSRIFFSDAAFGAKIRSPVELGIGVLRSMEANTNMQRLAGWLRDIGQMPFYPPNVKGWAGGKAWIDSSTLLGRANLVRTLLDDPDTQFGGGTLDEFFLAKRLKANEEIIDWLAAVLLAAPLPSVVRRELVAQLERVAVSRAHSLKNAVHLVAALPEFHLN